MMFLFVLLLAVTVSGKSLDLTKVNIDDLSPDAQKPVFRGASSAEEDDENLYEADSDVFEEAGDELPDEMTDKPSDEANDESSDEAAPAESTEATEATQVCGQAELQVSCSRRILQDGFPGSYQEGQLPGSVRSL
ncbi:unnamed protein product [Haemonchus placei]|uniref:Secreted protein n=1 Tax=Haemonchus placei TaxID=6290 RepID=A0A0N4W306_HAEPC|nr:unnamed protein product [Haemonchus placei]